MADGVVLTLDPVSAHWTEEVGVEAVGLLDLVQHLPDVHHLDRWTHGGVVSGLGGVA